MGNGKSKDQKVRLSYVFLLGHERAGTTFTLDELVAATGWRKGTATTYPKKKWAAIVSKDGQAYRVHALSDYTEDEYVRLMSQKDEVSSDPKRPCFAPDVEALVRKARESALLALQIYNAPATVFRTEGFSVLMVIAWTSLFHAVFEKRKKPYFYFEADGTPKLVDGDHKAWELGTCMKEFWGTADHATRRNVDFFILLRNRVEHRYVPGIDAHVAGECQALLLNFDDLLTAEFGGYYAIRESLAVPLQTSSMRTSAQTEALRKLQARHFSEVRDFIDAYRKELPASVYDDPKFSFRVFLIPKTGNHQSSSDVAFDFVKYDPSRPGEMAQLQKLVALVRERQVPVSMVGLLPVKLVVKAVAARIGRTFRQHEHTLAWKRYRVRGVGFDPSACNTKYCVPDAVHKDHAYTPAWVEFLVEKLGVASEYEALIARVT